MAFHLGSLGFLTPFKFDTYQTQVTQIIEGTWGEGEGDTKRTVVPPVLCPLKVLRVFAAPQATPPSCCAAA